MWGGGASPIGMSKENGTPTKERSAAQESKEGGRKEGAEEVA